VTQPEFAPAGPGSARLALGEAPVAQEEVPAWALAAGPAGIVAGVRAPWGFTHETWILSREDGPSVAAQRRSDRSDPTRPRARTVREAVRAAGLPVPEPAAAPNDGGRRVVTLPFVPGAPAAALLGTEEGAEAAGLLCGGVARTMAKIQPAGLGLGRTWASGSRLRTAGRAWLDGCSGELQHRHLRTIGHLLDLAVAAVDAAPAVLAHGDLVPVNVLVHDGSVAAVLDLDRARAAHPDFDATWFLWVVTHHHPEMAEAAWRGYARGAGLAPVIPVACGWLQPIQLLELAARAYRAADRRRWMARLETLLDGRAEGRGSVGDRR
jgi:aminoglycoside phosphotransferase (APT) family kinase protein